MRIPKKMHVLFGLSMVLAIPAARAQQGSQGMPDRPGRDAMPGMDMGDDPDQARAAGKTANDSMADHDVKMSPHMFMTDLRPHNAADDQRAAQIVEQLRKSIVKYKDYKVALADGFRIFLPNLPQPIYHFTNYGYGYEAEFHFDAEKPDFAALQKIQ